MDYKTDLIIEGTYVVMKKRQLLIILAAALLTTGCGSFNKNNAEVEVSEADTANSEEAAAEAGSESETEPEEEPVITYELAYACEDQIKIINDNFDVWKLTDEDREVFSPFMDYGYAIDDLDRDGYLEVIKTFWGGETMLYRTSVYETTDDKNLVEWDMDAFRQLDIEPCISELDGVYVIDNAKYMVYATEKESADSYWGMNTFYRMFIEDNKITLEEIKDGEQSWYFGNEKERFSWFQELSMENLTTSYEKKYFRDERDTTGLYTAYLNGETEAVQDCEYDDLINGATESGYTIHDYSYIDCGNDGVYELQAIVNAKELDNVSYSFVIKEDGSKLYIRYITIISAEKTEGSISPLGFVYEFGKGGASLAIYNYGFLDADARYHFFYECFYYLSIDNFDFGDDVEIDEEVWKDTQLMVYYLSEDHKDVENTYHQYFYTGDDKYYENDNIFKNTLEEAGFKTYTDKEIKKILNDRAKEIGLDPAIRND